MDTILPLFSLSEKPLFPFLNLLPEGRGRPEDRMSLSTQSLYDPQILPFSANTPSPVLVGQVRRLTFFPTSRDQPPAFCEGWRRCVPSCGSLRGRARDQGAAQLSLQTCIGVLPFASCCRGLRLQKIQGSKLGWFSAPLSVGFFSFGFMKSTITYPLLSICKIVLLLSFGFIHLFLSSLYCHFSAVSR